MTTSTFTIGQQVVRSKGDYVVGSIGNIIAIDSEKNRAQVAWEFSNKTWVSFTAIEPTSIPYKILPAYQKSLYVRCNPKYVRL